MKFTKKQLKEMIKEELEKEKVFLKKQTAQESADTILEDISEIVSHIFHRDSDNIDKVLKELKNFKTKLAKQVSDLKWE